MKLKLKVLQGGKITPAQKKEYVKNEICRRYEAEDKASNAVNIPYFLRAENKVKQLELSGRLNSVYDDMRKGKPCMI